jgi:transcriptional regulator with XRE-family HTH domain
MKNSIGERVKTMRVTQKMTLADLGEKASLSTSYLSQIERDKTMPSLNTLMNLALALNVDARYFFDSLDSDILISRNGKEHQPKFQNPGMVCYPLSPANGNNTLKVYRIVIEPQTYEEFVPYSGEEFVYVLSGELVVGVGNEAHTLREGDSIHYDALFLESWSNPTDQPCHLIRSWASY